MITQEYLKKLLEYNPNTGLLIAKTNRNTIKKGMEVGTINSVGYRVISIDDSKYTAHELAWLYMTGKFPKETIDHVDLNRLNNRWSNLREASQSQNNMNRKLQSNNTSGFKGVCWCKTTNKWRVRIKVKGKYTEIGRFTDINEAAEASKQARLQYHGEFARHN